MATQFDVEDPYAGYEEDPCEPVSFEFPDVCCRCLAPAPQKLWKVQRSKKMEGANAFIDYEVQVPICGGCWTKLMNIRLHLLSATGGLALMALAGLAWSDPFELNSADFQTVVCGYGLMALGLSGVSIAVYYTLAAIVAPKRARGVADLSINGDQITFFNPEYHRLFLEHARGPRVDGPGW
jgi:hypothetical protein